MQGYRELCVLTARPTPEQEALAPHELYGVRPAAEAGSAAWWRGAALAAMDRARARQLLPILCGGTGLYLAALIEGLADIPDPGEAARAEARALLAAEGAPALHARLAALDPATAARLRPADSQRVARAWEVLRGTGRGLAAWQRAAGQGATGQGATGQGAPWRFSAILLDPPRPALRAAIRTRLDAMLRAGALDEVRALLDLRLDPALPALRAHGVPELSAHLRGALTLSEARTRIELATAQYAKRQSTWFRHRVMADPDRTHRILSLWGHDTQFYGSQVRDLVSFVRRAG
jgi:tRNA dimethylallyltransferase